MPKDETWSYTALISALASVKRVEVRLENPDLPVVTATFKDKVGLVYYIEKQQKWECDEFEEKIPRKRRFENIEGVLEYLEGSEIDFTEPINTGQNESEYLRKGTIKDGELNLSELLKNMEEYSSFLAQYKNDTS